jgi:hypothetical protein
VDNGRLFGEALFLLLPSLTSLVPPQDLHLSIDEALSSAGFDAETTAKYAVALKEEGFDQLRYVVSGDALNPASLCRLGLKQGHAGRFVSHFSHLDPNQATNNTTVTLFVQVKEGPRQHLPSVGYKPVSALDPSMTFAALFNHIAEGNDEVQQLNTGQVPMTVRSFEQQGIHMHPAVHDLSAQISELPTQALRLSPPSPPSPPGAEV